MQTLDTAMAKRLVVANAIRGAYEAAAYDIWFRAQVQESLNDPRPGVPHEEVEEYFAGKRAELEARIAAEGCKV